MPSQVLGAVLALSSSLAACQPLDSAAAAGDLQAVDVDDHTVALDPPAIELADGGSVNDACAATTIQAHEILENNCARCHGGATPGARQGSPPFDCVLDTTRLLTMVSATAVDPDTMQPAHFLVPGDPDHSRIYLRPLHGEMPPPDVVGLPPNPRPSVSDLSVLRQWISSCVEQPDGGTPEPSVSDAGVPSDTH
ncbi:MAG TPA: hypothetical protein VHZ95_08990 [Polyangiales bacterium]|nr:hypothetical protein [Polyangiales bacterium]